MFIFICEVFKANQQAYSFNPEICSMCMRVMSLACQTAPKHAMRPDVHLACVHRWNIQPVRQPVRQPVGSRHKK